MSSHALPLQAGFLILASERPGICSLQNVFDCVAEDTYYCPKPGNRIMRNSCGDLSLRFAPTCALLELRLYQSLCKCLTCLLSSFGDNCMLNMWLYLEIAVAFA